MSEPTAPACEPASPQLSLREGIAALARLPEHQPYRPATLREAAEALFRLRNLQSMVKSLLVLREQQFDTEVQPLRDLKAAADVAVAEAEETAKTTALEVYRALPSNDRKKTVGLGFVIQEPTQVEWEAGEVIAWAIKHKREKYLMLDVKAFKQDALALARAFPEDLKSVREVTSVRATAPNQDRLRGFLGTPGERAIEDLFGHAGERMVEKIAVEQAFEHAGDAPAGPDPRDEPPGFNPVEAEAERRGQDGE